MFSLYGVVALVDIAVDAFIVIIDAAIRRLDMGMSVLRAAIYVSRQRVMHIVITPPLTIIAGLFSLTAD